MGRLAVTEAQQRRMFFEGQLASTKDALTKAEITLRSGGIESDTFKASPGAAVSAVAQIQAQITAQEVKLGAMRGYLTERAPEFKQALVELQALRAQLAKFESSDEANLPAATNPVVADYITRFRDFKYYETLFELFAKQYEIARIDESREGAVIQIVDPAIEPEWKSAPKRALIAVIATLAAGFILLLWAFVRKGLANATRDEETAQRLQRVKSLLMWKRVR
jgi:tyrosine-protein kinase Etk/Wzc